VDAEGLKDLFAPFAAVSLKRMFSGHGVYADGVCFALHLRDDIYLKADKETQARFEAAKSEPFAYDGHRGKVTVTSYWRLPPEAYDDPDELKDWSALALQAARRFAAAKAMKAGNKMKIAKAAKSVKKVAKGRAAIPAKARRPARGKGRPK
jgi:DNA transformation protein and related proteins